MLTLLRRVLEIQLPFMGAVLPAAVVWLHAAELFSLLIRIYSLLSLRFLLPDQFP